MVRCVDVRASNQPVAVKMIRNNDVMRKAADTEISVLQQITRADPENKKHCVRMLAQSEYRNHIVIVFGSDLYFYILIFLFAILDK